MLNRTQEAIILGTVQTHFEDIRNLEPALAIRLLRSVINDNDYEAIKDNFATVEQREAVEGLRQIYNHQNPCASHYNGGLLNLSSRNDATAAPATRDDVRFFLNREIENQIQIHIGRDESTSIVTALTNRNNLLQSENERHQREYRIPTSDGSYINMTPQGLGDFIVKAGKAFERVEELEKREEKRLADKEARAPQKLAQKKAIASWASNMETEVNYLKKRVEEERASKARIAQGAGFVLGSAGAAVATGGTSLIVQAAAVTGGGILGAYTGKLANEKYEKYKSRSLTKF